MQFQPWKSKDVLPFLHMHCWKSPPAVYAAVFAVVLLETTLTLHKDEIICRQQKESSVSAQAMQMRWCKYVVVIVKARLGEPTPHWFLPP